jgi:glycosyltransferase involved in cell wall biosynthesis
LDLPRNLLYATSAGLGGSGLDAVALESLRVASRAGILGLAYTFRNGPNEIPGTKVRSLRWHPVRLLSALGSQYYYGAKKHAVDRAAAAELAASFTRGTPYDLFHGWSGESVLTLLEAKRRGVPSVIEIGTWHRHKGRKKNAAPTQSERQRAAATGWEGWKNRLLISRQQTLEEYELADLLFVLSSKAEETFLAAGVDRRKLFRHQRGVDVERFTPAPEPPKLFRAVFVGALITRKGVHHLLECWRRLALPNAELVLVGSVHPEIEPYLADAGESVKVAGFVGDVQECYRSAAVHVFPSECEGSAKCTYEAAACGLPQITTREAGDVVLDRVNGLIIPPNDPDALAEAILTLYRDRELCVKFGGAGRRRVVENFTWTHFGERLLEGYRLAMTLNSLPA